MADGLDDIRRDIVTLSTQEKTIIARDVLPSLDPEDRNNIVLEFTDSPELRQDQLRELREKRQDQLRELREERQQQQRNYRLGIGGVSLFLLLYC